MAVKVDVLYRTGPLILLLCQGEAESQEKDGDEDDLDHVEAHFCTDWYGMIWLFILILLSETVNNMFTIYLTCSVQNNAYEAVSGWGPGFDLGPKNVYFGETHIKDQNSNTKISELIPKM